MSNQIYSNSREKYYEQRGVSEFVMASTPTLPSGFEGPLPITLVSLQQGPAFETISSPGRFIFSSSGVYSIKASVGITPAVLGTMVFHDMNIIKLGGSNDTSVLSRRRFYSPTTTDPRNLIETIVFTGFFAQGEGFGVNFNNYSTVAVDLVLADTNVIICRLL